MTNFQKIIKSFWFILFFASIVYSFYDFSNHPYKDLYDLINLIIMFQVIIGIPSFVIYKIWSPKKSTQKIPQ